jgi:hypothetical protein
MVKAYSVGPDRKIAMDGEVENSFAYQSEPSGTLGEPI